MTKADFENKIDTLIDRVIKRAKSKAKFIFEYGGIETDKYPNNYALPMIIMTVVLEELAAQHRPENDPEKSEYRKLSHF